MENHKSDKPNNPEEDLEFGHLGVVADEQTGRDEAEEISWQKSPVLRPVQRSPCFSSNPSLNGSFVENNASEFSHNLDNHLPIDPQNYVLQCNGFARDANASGASQSVNEVNPFVIEAEAESALFSSGRVVGAPPIADEMNDIIVDNSENYLVSESENAEADQYLELEHHSAGMIIAIYFAISSLNA